MVLYEGSPQALPSVTPELASKASPAPVRREENSGEVIALTAPAGPPKLSDHRRHLAPSTAVYSGGAVAAPRTLLDIFFTTVDNYPDAIALDDGVVALTYMDLLGRIESVAQILRESGIGTGDRVGIRVPSGTNDLYIAVLAAMNRGAAYVPVDHDEPEERATLVWEEASVSAVIGSGLNVHLRPESPPHGKYHRPTGDDDAWIIFTSGSTGKPKGVAISHRSAAAFVDAEASVYCVDAPLGPGDRVLAGLSVGFDASCEEMWLAWRYGACLVPAPREVVRSGEDLGPWMAARGITAISTVPTLAAMWPAESLDNIRLLIFGGEACPPELAARLATDGREVWNTYGPTEATVVSTAALVDGATPVRIGLPLRGWQLAVVDAEDQPVPWGEVGQLVIGGAGLGRYLDPEKDAEKYAPMTTLGWPRAYRSGDLVRAEIEGLIFVGRADDQVKLAGQRIELGEVDDALSHLPNVAAGASAVQKSPDGNGILAGYLVPAAGKVIDLAEARARLSEQLPGRLVPALAVIDELPVKTSGKVDRKALPWPLPADPSAAAAAATLHTDFVWLAEKWTSLLGPVPMSADSDFFTLGGSSLSAAQLVSMLRKRYPDVSIADLYAHPTLSAMSSHLRQLDPTSAVERTTRPTPRWTGFLQLPLIASLYGIIGLRYVTGIAIVCLVLFQIGETPWVPNPPLIPTIIAWAVLFSLPARALAAIGSSRLLLFKVRPGIYPRGGVIHIRLWAAERIMTFCQLDGLMGTPMAPAFARALGAGVGKDVHLDALPPVTGLAAIESGASIERDVDLAGHWLEGDTLHIGIVRIGQNARVGTRATLQGGAVIGDDAEIAPASVVTGMVPKNEYWAGSPLERVGTSGQDWPESTQQESPHSRGTDLLYPLGLVLLGLLALAAPLPGAALMFYLISDFEALAPALWTLAAWTPVFVLLTVVTYLGLLAGSVRLMGRLMPRGTHSVHSVPAWAAWMSGQLMSKSLINMYPLYSSMATPFWLRLLGAHVGKDVEAATVEAIPHLTSVGDKAFLADHSLVSSKYVRHGWVRLESGSVGQKAFLGNSAILGPDQRMPSNSLVAVLSSAPKSMPANSLWLGNPPIELPRAPEPVDASLTYEPSRRLKLARATVELCRMVPMFITAWLALITVFVLSTIFDAYGLLVAVLFSGPVLLASGIVAALIPMAAKWLLVGRFKATQKPLWSSFVWRNELADCFSEALAVPGLIRMSLGTPLLNLWLRGMGARIGRGVWCETWWLPEFDLIQLDKAATINRGTVLQTHLFHDRIMRLDRVHFEEGSSLGPNSIVLPGSSLGAHASVGAGSLVMRSESIPESTTWNGNPIRRTQVSAGTRESLAPAGTLR
ncbi:amino acid adenylation domain-containing protein [Nesterenkonia sp. E16_7]|uniref:Pls/PosA family non-ribosomal peptide synthetase n=1 Tax=unclassified Nesterenkonia TaxID=2629769 RepID=UPI001A93480B|nr:MULTISPECIES: Pls/PosA family non-ribosomal peptide synthetase [unclassified Nesterenkonia]MBO0595376.1 amino acid adenylation domain-containing protein [Nesterenkonia sp. E16_10]MBO0599176.1 amino acid adenylation domain-containing protein [Nesterenkonia sp. E16_7]